MNEGKEGIEGLRWEDHSVIRNGSGSVVVPFPTTDLFHIVFHGDEPFAHGRYGLHRGLEDRLTFLGPSKVRARGFFVDCRRGSPTLHNRVSFVFSPDSTRSLIVPCGVGHGFEGLQGVYTLNGFRAYLPTPEHLLTEQNPWATGADIYNFPYDTTDSGLPVVDINSFPASDVFYEVLSEMQKATLGTIEYEFPHTEDFTDSNGQSVTLMIRKRLSEGQQLPAWTPIDGIDGLGWSKHLVVWSGASAGYAALTDPTPMQIIDHGEESYSTDAYGIHLEWEDRLTFVGPSDQTGAIRFVDCRAGSPTLGREVRHEFRPSPFRMLIIPPGIAHAFESLERIVTVNRPIRRAGNPTTLEPGNDVIDWPLEERPLPTFEVGSHEFDFSYYSQLAKHQRDYLSSRGDDLSTPAVLLVDDGNGGESSRGATTLNYSTVVERTTPSNARGHGDHYPLSYRT